MSHRLLWFQKDFRAYEWRISNKPTIQTVCFRQSKKRRFHYDMVGHIMVFRWLYHYQQWLENSERISRHTKQWYAYYDQHIAPKCSHITEWQCTHTLSQFLLEEHRNIIWHLSWPAQLNRYGDFWNKERDVDFHLQHLWSLFENFYYKNETFHWKLFNHSTNLFSEDLQLF